MGFVVSPLTRCNPVRMCTAVGTLRWIALNVRLMVVGDNHAWRVRRAAQRLLEERFGGSGVAVFPQQHVDNLAVLVDGTVQIPLVLAAEEEHLVGVPGATERPTVFASFSRQLRPVYLDPARHRPVR